MPDPGDIIVAELVGASENKRRPAVVLSSKTYHDNRPDVVVGIITTNIVSASAPSDCILADWRSAGLIQPSAFRAYLVTLGKSDCRVIGHLSTRDWKAVQACIHSALEIGTAPTRE